MIDGRPVLLLPRHPPHGTPLAPGSTMARYLAAWVYGKITGPPPRSSRIGRFWKTAPFTADTVHDVFDVRCICPYEGGKVHSRLIAARIALRALTPDLEGRVVVMCGRDVDLVMHGPSKDPTPYGTVRALDLNHSRLLPTPDMLIAAGEPSGKARPNERQRPLIFCTTVLAPNPAPINRAITQYSGQLSRIEFGAIYREALKVKHRLPRLPEDRVPY